MTSQARSELPNEGLPTARTRVLKAADVVAAELRRRIVCKQLLAGEMLPPEAVLLMQFGVSRQTLREALRILEAERLVVVRRGSRGGAQVLVPDADVAAHQVGLLLQYRGGRVRDVYEAAARVESSVVADVAATRDDEGIAALEACLARLRETSVEDPSYSAVDREFHLTLGRLCSNKTLYLCLQLIDEVLTAGSQLPLRHDASAQNPAKQYSLKRYAKLVQLIRDRDVDGARSHWHKHMLAVGDYLAGDEDTVVDLFS